MQYTTEKKQEVHDNVKVYMRDRVDRPQASTFYYGPTNSGKTYHALENLRSEYESNPEGIYVYAGPLRMLALEVYEKLVAIYGASAVGLITGEEAINPTASLLSTTTEMAPQEGNSIVIDESHWIAEEGRGNSWTRLLVSGRYDNFHIVSAEEAGPILESLLEDSHSISRNVYTRKTDISYKGNIQLKDIPSKTAVICFSRKRVYEVAALLEKQGIKAGVLYGALPPSVRKQQIQLFIDGVYDVIVTTDVIGHGINLPIDNVVFTQTSKFDGSIVRPLKRWELAQIAGRAGRFGLSTEGSVYTVKTPRALIDTNLVDEGVLCAKGKLSTDLNITKAVLKPKLSDLGLLDDESIWLSYALGAWQEKSGTIPALIKPASLDDVNEHIGFIGNYLRCFINPWDKHGGEVIVNGKTYVDTRQKEYDWKLPLNEVWTLANGPYDASNGVLEVMTTWLATKNDAVLQEFYTKVQTAQKSSKLDVLEKASHQIGELKMAGVMFAVDGKLGPLYTRRFDSLGDKIVMRIAKILIGQYQAKLTKTVVEQDNPILVPELVI